MNKRERFLADMMENILLPYEVSEEYEEETIGEFENRSVHECGDLDVSPPLGFFERTLERREPFLLLEVSET